MFGVITKAALATTLAVAAYLALMESSMAGPDAAIYVSVGADTSVPYGWVEFCGRYRGECPDDDRAAQPIDLTPAVMRKIQRINAAVNKSVAPVSDMDHWGVVDQWDYPTDGKGDCEDYALLKRRMLMDEGFPRQALLMTVVKEANGDGHAVLTVKTNRGEFVLDNLGDEVKAWNRTPYRFVKRQSEQNPNVWVSIGSPTAAPAYVSK
ncbi:MAG: transglutaminase-like cysteine peptidase [Methylocystis sp.]